MTTWFDQCFEKLIAHEGGYVNHASDPGGETNYGISKRAYPSLDIKALTLADAKAIYKRDYWDRAQCDQLPSQLSYLVFDAAVNSGIGQSIRFLQRAVGVADDGSIGPITLSAAKRMDTESLCARFLGHRLEFMTKLSTFDVFGKGWARRVADQLKGL
jgi:lysozyme family protein